MDPTTIFVAVLSLLGGGAAAALITAWFSRKKIQADAQYTSGQLTQTLTASSINLLEPLNKQIDQLEERLEKMQKQVDDMYRQLKFYHDRYGPPTPTSTFYPIDQHRIH